MFLTIKKIPKVSWSSEKPLNLRPKFSVPRIKYCDTYMSSDGYPSQHNSKFTKYSSSQDLCRVYNLGNGAGFSVKEILSITEKISKKKIKRLISSRRIGDPAVLIASAAKINKELGWEPKYPNIEDIISHALCWHRKNLSRRKL